MTETEVNLAPPLEKVDYEPSFLETPISMVVRRNDEFLLLEARIKILEDRLNIMMALKKNGLDLSKFCFDLQPI